jgi:hypothetical protein
MEHCQRCGGKIYPGELHHCQAGSIQAPILSEILAELKAIRQELGKQGSESHDPQGLKAKAKRRETR